MKHIIITIILCFLTIMTQAQIQMKPTSKQIQEKLLYVQSELTRLERELAETPSSDNAQKIALTTNIDELKIQQDNLKMEIERATEMEKASEFFNRKSEKGRIRQGFSLFCSVKIRNKKEEHLVCFCTFL